MSAVLATINPHSVGLIPPGNTVFLSHSKHDPSLNYFKDVFLSAGATPRIISLEDIQPPPWYQITEAIWNSGAVWVLLHSKLLEPTFQHTANWISYEVGVASESNRPVVVFEPLSTPVEFCVPYCSFRIVYDSNDTHPRTHQFHSLTNLAKICAIEKPPSGWAVTPQQQDPASRWINLAMRLPLQGRRRQCRNPECGLTWYELGASRSQCPSCRKPRP